jgi:NADH-quinone oxidoreductase subunit E
MPSFDSLESAAAAIIAKYPSDHKRSAVMPLLHLVQKRDRCVTGEAIKWIAARLELQPINVWELVTFYPSFKEKPMGKIHIRVCKTLSCMMAGAQKTGEALAKALDCPIGQTRDDGEVSIEWVECLACCDKAPVMLVNEKLRTGVTPDKVAGLVEELKVPTSAAR